MTENFQNSCELTLTGAITMQRPFCNLSARDYGLKDHPDSFKAAKEINATILDVIDLKYMSYESKWLAIYQTLQKHKNLGAVNQKALDKIEAIFFLNGIETMKSKAQSTKVADIVKQERKTKEAKEKLWFYYSFALLFALLAFGWGLVWRIVN